MLDCQEYILLEHTDHSPVIFVACFDSLLLDDELVDDIAVVATQLADDQVRL